MTRKISYLEIHELRHRVYRWVLGLFGLNLADLSFTVFFLTRGMEEANPLMAYLWETNPAIFVAIKTLGVACLLGIFNLLMFAPRHLVMIQIATAIYALLSVYHIAGLVVFF